MDRDRHKSFSAINRIGGDLEQVSFGKLENQSPYYNRRQCGSEQKKDEINKFLWVRVEKLLWIEIK